MESFHTLKDTKDLFFAQNAGELLLAFGLEICEDVPIAFEYVYEEEFDPAICNAQGGGGPFIRVSAVQEVVLQFKFCDRLRAFAVVFQDHPHSAGVAFLRSLAHSGKLKGSDGLFVVVFHGNSPFWLIGEWNGPKGP